MWRSNAYIQKIRSPYKVATGQCPKPGGTDSIKMSGRLFWIPTFSFLNREHRTIENNQGIPTLFYIFSDPVFKRVEFLLFPLLRFAFQFLFCRYQYLWYYHSKKKLICKKIWFFATNTQINNDFTVCNLLFLVITTFFLVIWGYSSPTYDIVESMVACFCPLHARQIMSTHNFVFIHATC